MSLAALKAAKDKLKKEVQDASALGGKRFMTKGDLEAAKLKRIRDEEEKEREEKVGVCGALR